MSTATRPSDRLDATAWEVAIARLVTTLRDLIRIPSVNPADAYGGELAAARHVAALLEDAGLRPEVVEPVEGRGSVVARLHGDGSGGDPLLLLSHLDVVPAPADHWTHDPFGADLADGYVWGRGAVDMKDLVAMEVEVLRMLAEEARAAGRDPAADPIPGLRRDVLFAATADEEAGGLAGAAWLAEFRPETLRAAGGINESGAVATHLGGRTFYPIQVAEKGYAVYRVIVHGTSGHGSMPRSDNAVLLAAEAIRRLAVPSAARATPLMARFLDRVAAEIPADAGRVLRALARGDARAEAAIEAGLCNPSQARTIRALLRDTVSPDIVHAGIKYNVIPGEALIELDCRVLPGTSESAMRASLVERLGPELAPRCEVELILFGEPVESPEETELFEILARVVRDHDPAGIPLAVMAPFGTDAKHLARLGVPTYGFSPLRLAADEPYLERFHGVDERVGVDALRWGLPVLYDAVRRFCG